MSIKQRLWQYLAIGIIQLVTLILLGVWIPGLQIQSIASAIALLVAFSASQVVYWWLFVNFFSYFPAWLYPTFSTVLTVSCLMLFGNWIPGILIVDFRSGFWITVILTAVNVILSGYLSLDIDYQFDRQITRKLMRKHGSPRKTGEPGILYLEIDGLSEHVFRKALQQGKMPTLKRWHEQGSHKILGWEADFSSQTAAVQAGILLGNNDNIPAYRWWDRDSKRVIRSGSFREAASLEKQRSSGEGLLANGGVSRGNMFSGDAKESMFTISTALNQKRDRGPRLYLYLVNPFIIVQLGVRFVYAALRELWQSTLQKLRRDKYRVRSRNLLFALTWAAESQLLQGLTTYFVIADLLRGVPAIYATYPGYDSIGHYSGGETKEAFQTLEEIDRFFARLERAARYAPRPYHIVILSDHGQSNGGSFSNTYGVTLEQLVKGSIGKESQLLVSEAIDESWDKIDAFLNDSIDSQGPAAKVLQTMIDSHNRSTAKKSLPGLTGDEPHPDALPPGEDTLVVIGSGCAGLVYFADEPQRLPYEVIQSACPNLIPSLIGHPGIAFVLVHSAGLGNIVLGKGGIYYLDNETFDGENPLEGYSANAAKLLRRECSFANCPDIIVNTRYDSTDKVLTGFEDQVGHHGGLGGEQSFPFIFHPVSLPENGKPVTGSIEVYQLLRGWRRLVQENMDMPDNENNRIPLKQAGAQKTSEAVPST